MFREQMQEYVEVSREIVKVIMSDNAAAALKKSLDWQETVIDSLTETENQAADLVRDILSVEEEVAEKLLETEETMQKSSSKLRQIELELQDVCQKNESLETSIKFLKKELEEVKNMEEEIAELEKEVREDTTVVIPSALYMAKLFHSVTKIDWDYNCDSTLIKGSVVNGCNHRGAVSLWQREDGCILTCSTGPSHTYDIIRVHTIPQGIIEPVHYGGEIAQPICIDSTQHSQIFICDYLWSLLSTEW